MFTQLHEIAAGPNALYLLLALVGIAAVLSPLELWYPANRQRLFRYKGVLLDIGYWFFTPLVTRLATNYVLGAILFVVYYLQGRALDASLVEGFGPLSRQPLALQALEILLLADFIDYWTHRAFHTSRFWRIHAIHHSPEHMSWIASSRMHPLNDLVTRTCQVIPIAMLGFAGKAILVVLPYLFFYVIFVHSNLSWNFGRFRYLLVSPAYHRWHHTTDAEGIDKNFAGIFPVWDILFGTCHFPKRLPKKYGVTGGALPDSFFSHLLYPFTGLSRPAPRPQRDESKDASDRLPSGESHPACLL